MSKLEIIRPNPIDKEVVWDKNETLVSKTDLSGTIEYANNQFIDVSGYEDFELMTKPHSLIRHPDMPKVIFKVLWDNIKVGNQFHGIVKNLAKSGRYYWAITSFEYVTDSDGNITNYIGRRKSVPQEVITKHIQPLYTKLLQIEKTSGELASEKYLIGFLEELGLNYVDYVTSLMIDNSDKSDDDNINTTTVEKKKSFFGKYFS